MSGFGFAESASTGNLGTRNPLLSSSGTQVPLSAPGTFYTYTLPASSVQTDGDFFHIEAGFVITGDPRNITISLNFDAGSITRSYTIGGFGDDYVTFTAEVARKSATTAQLSGALYENTASTLYAGQVLMSSANVAATFSGAIVVSLTATTLTSGTATGQYFYIASYFATG